MTKTNILQQDRPMYTLTVGEYIELNRQILFETKENSSDPVSESQDEILSIDQATKLLKLAKPTIYGMTCRNQIPFIKKAKKLYFRRSELLHWLNDGRVKTDDEIRKEVESQGFSKSGRR